MNFHSMNENMRVSYTAVVLNELDRNNLLSHISPPEGWEVIAHHMTINMGDASKGPAMELLGQDVKLKVVTLAQDDRVMAVGVESKVPSNNNIKHITIAVNRSNGGKPFQSNQLVNWTPIPNLILNGVVAEVDSSGNVV